MRQCIVPTVQAYGSSVMIFTENIMWL